MRTAHIPCGLGGSLWTGAILGWEPVYALDFEQWRVDRVLEQQRAGWWPSFRYDCADLTDWQPPELDGPVDLLAAGFSCRDISIAGGGAGLGGSSTGPTYRGCLSAIDAFRPAWVFFENSPEIRTRGLATVLADLRDRGYRARNGIIAASDVGGPHQRDRWYLLAHRADVDGARELQSAWGLTEGGGRPGDVVHQEASDTPGQRRSGRGRHGAIEASAGAHSLLEHPRLSSDPADIAGFGRQQGGPESAHIDHWPMVCAAAAEYCGAWHWNPPDPSLRGLVDGLAYPRGDAGRYISGLGDAWVPLQAAVAWRLLGGP